MQRVVGPTCRFTFSSKVLSLTTLFSSLVRLLICFCSLAICAAELEPPVAPLLGDAPGIEVGEETGMGCNGKWVRSFN